MLNRKCSKLAWVAPKISKNKLATSQKLGGKGVSNGIPANVENRPKRTATLGDILAELSRMVIWRKGEHVECCEKGGVCLISIIVDYIDNLAVPGDISVDDNIQWIWAGGRIVHDREEFGDELQLTWIIQKVGL